ncbi:MAG TPA: hypothetical protein VFI90_03465, partial [Rubrobacter sp.]|nr:hypothetical protein [Rubrobacter sp.]
GAILPILASCALLGVAVAHAKPPDKPDYLASMKAVHTMEHSPHTSSIGKIDSPPKDDPSSKKEDHEQAQNESSKDTKKDQNSEGSESKASDETQSKGSGEDSDAPGAKSEKTAKKTSAGGSAGKSEFTGSVSAIGDSVMLGAVGRLQKDIQGLTVVDAEVGLQVYTAIDILKSRLASGQLGEVVIVHLGNNGTFTKGQFDQIMRILSGHRVVFVNVKVPRAWEEPNNEVISEGVQRYPNAVLVDWHSASANRPELFYSDGFHLRPRGQRIYADMVSSYLTKE